LRWNRPHEPRPREPAQRRRDQARRLAAGARTAPPCCATPLAASAAAAGLAVDRATASLGGFLELRHGARKRLRWRQDEKALTEFPSGGGASAWILKSVKHDPIDHVFSSGGVFRWGSADDQSVPVKRVRADQVRSGPAGHLILGLLIWSLTSLTLFGLSDLVPSGLAAMLVVGATGVSGLLIERFVHLEA
jgi:hypothetical protein